MDECSWTGCQLRFWQSCLSSLLDNCSMITSSEDVVHCCLWKLAYLKHVRVTQPVDVAAWLCRTGDHCILRLMLECQDFISILAV